jgi:hypothetical protein
LHGDQPTHRARRKRWPTEEISTGPGQVRHGSDKQLDWDEPGQLRANRRRTNSARWRRCVFSAGRTVSEFGFAC